MTENVFNDRGLQNYLQEISNTPTLNRDEEQELAIKAQQGDQTAIQKLIESNLKFVVKIASRYQNRGLSLSELISEGNMGLIKAIEKFEAGRDIKLISYAVWWIRQRILFALAEKTNLIRVPLGKSTTFNKIRVAQDKIKTETGEDPSLEEIATETDIDEKMIKRIKDKNIDTLSIDEISYGNKNEQYHLLDFLSDPSSADPKTIYYRDQTNRKIQDSISRLDPRSASVIRSYFGLDGEDSKNFAEIAEDLGLSRERIRQIQKEALKQILKDTQEDLYNDIDYLIAGRA